MKKLLCCIALAATLVLLPAQRRSQTEPEKEPSTDIRLPNGKSQQEEILKAEYQKTLKDAAELIELSEQLKAELEKNDRHVLSLSSLKKTEEIEKLAKRIRARLRH
jgi:Tfp pilus assembly protein PilO